MDAVEVRKMAVDGREADSLRRREGRLDRGRTEGSSKQFILCKSSNDLFDGGTGSKDATKVDCSEKECRRLRLQVMGIIGTATASSIVTSGVASLPSDESTAELFSRLAKRTRSSLEKCCRRILSGRDRNHCASA